VSLFLSKDKTINPAADRLLKKVSFVNGLTPGQIKKTITNATIPNYYVNGLFGNYYYGAVVELSKKASLNHVAILRYKDNGDGTVSDYKTNLMWKKSDEGVHLPCSDAGSYCEGLEFAGYDDWLLPSIEELTTIVDYAKHDPAIDSIFDCQSTFYWSSSISIGLSANAWNVQFYSGYVYAYDKSYKYHVRCVRGGPW
jgi:hypothetical protein